MAVIVTALPSGARTSLIVVTPACVSGCDVGSNKELKRMAQGPASPVRPSGAAVLPTPGVQETCWALPALSLQSCCPRVG